MIIINLFTWIAQEYFFNVAKRKISDIAFLIKVKIKNDQLEAHPIKNNLDLWNFKVKSANINWDKFVSPVLQRSSAVLLGEHFDVMKMYETVEENRMKVFVAHDMMGSYLEDRFFSSSKKFDDYRFLHWSGIDYFCYFSHQYITIPPSNWINAAHKHGVCVLGTFITEWSDGKTKLLEVLESKESIDKTTDSLLKCCKHFKFEGWLINIECEVPTAKVDQLIYFLSSLREKITRNIKNGKIFWYDSVVSTGKLTWQNSINEKNFVFFDNSDNILLNYNWGDKQIKETNETLTKYGSSKRGAFFGIDIFGRGQVAGFETHKTLSRITDYSVGFFATGWTFEKLGEMLTMDIKKRNGDVNINKVFLDRNEYFWKSLWKYLPTFPYNNLPFTTFFCVGSGESFFESGNKIGGPFFTLASQSLQPSVPIHNKAERCFSDAVNGGCCLNIVQESKLFRIFLTNFNINHMALVSYAYKTSDLYDKFDVVLRFETDSETTKDCYIFMGNYGGRLISMKGRCYMSPLGKNVVPLLVEQLNSEEIKYELSNGWITRYYLISFDTPIIIKDIGVLFERNRRNKDSTCYLGGLHINSIDDFRVPDGVNISRLNVIKDDLIL